MQESFFRSRRAFVLFIQILSPASVTAVIPPQMAGFAVDFSEIFCEILLLKRGAGSRICHVFRLPLHGAARKTAGINCIPSEFLIWKEHSGKRQDRSCFIVRVLVEDVTDGHIAGTARLYDENTILTVNEEEFFNLYENMPEEAWQTLFVLWPNPDTMSNCLRSCFGMQDTKGLAQPERLISVCHL